MAKIKIHEIAKKIGLTSKEIIEKANELGINVKSHLSSIEDEQAEKIEKSLANKKESKKNDKDKNQGKEKSKSKDDKKDSSKDKKKQQETPVIIRREVIVSEAEPEEKSNKKQENKNNIGFVERNKNKNYNIVYRNKQQKPLTVSELFGIKDKKKEEEERRKAEEEKKKASDLFDRKSDICIDTIGSNQTITQCLDYIKETGTIAVYGLKSGENLNVPLPELRNFNIQYVQWPVPEVEAEVHKPVCDAIMDGKIDIDLFVTHRFSIDDYEKGFQAVKDRTALMVVLIF